MRSHLYVCLLGRLVNSHAFTSTGLSEALDTLWKSVGTRDHDLMYLYTVKVKVNTCGLGVTVVVV